MENMQEYKIKLDKLVKLIQENVTARLRFQYSNSDNCDYYHEKLIRSDEKISSFILTYKENND